MIETTRIMPLIGLALAFGAPIATPVSAAILAFTGAANATAAPFPDASCAPLPFRGIIAPGNASGSSNLGSFSYSHNVCTQGATGPITGVFTIDFGTASFTGLLDGFSAARNGTPGLFDQMFSYVVTSGTGRFAGATGSFTNIGTADVRGGPPSRLNLNFTGTINAPGVPEPASWMLLIAGFGITGAALRQRRTQKHNPTAFARHGP
jgi:hypothetical protein